MTTVNISITNEQAKFIDQLSAKYNFENRSELLRNLIRVFQFHPQLVNEVMEFPFVEPFTRSRSKMYQSVAKTGKYSKEFLKDLKEGLEDSKDFFYDK